MNKPLLIIGKPDSSKTVFTTQLYSCLRQNKSKLSLYKPVENLSAINLAREALAKGLEPDTTPVNKSVKIELPIQFKEEKINVVCPDYGGEQITQILSNRSLGKDWKKAVLNSNNWLFFIRINSISKSIDISDLTIKQEHIESRKKEIDTENNKEKYSLSDQSSLIELLQIFLDTKNHNYHFKNNTIKLTTVLTCWDELETKDIPSNILKNNLPLLLRFIKSNFESKNHKILGLSAQGFALNSIENKEKYEIDGPERFPFIIKEDGEKIYDITELIIESL